MSILAGAVHSEPTKKNVSYIKTIDGIIGLPMKLQSYFSILNYWVKTFEKQLQELQKDTM